MRKLPEVEEAKALMTEAIGWSVMKWLTEKKRVRKMADKANQSLWAMQKEVKAGWSEHLLTAYEKLAADKGNSGKTNRQPRTKDGPDFDDGIRRFAMRVKEADDTADRAHEEAEATFSKAERILSTSLAREGCRKAIASWDLYERAILAAENGVAVKVGK